MIADNNYKIEIGTDNLVALLGKDGLWLSDCVYKNSRKQLDSLLLTLSSKFVKCTTNMNWNHDHCGGNFFYNQHAITISHEDTRDILTQNDKSTFCDEEYHGFPDYALPDVTFKNKVTLYFNDEETARLHLPSGHFNGDIIVYIKNLKVIHLGNLLFSFGFPAIDFEHGGHVKRFAENLHKILKIIPDDVLIIAGHGPNLTVKN